MLGGGIAGLLAAAALAPHYARVTILDRDRIQTRPMTRKGVPQDKHPHILLRRGEEIMRELVPGALDDLRPQDLVPMNPGRNLRWHHGGVWKARRDPGFDFHMCNRVRLEHALRQRVLARGNVELLCEHKVLDVQVDYARRRVTGVFVQGHEDQHARLLEAPLVVDATGRGTRAPLWLKLHGFGEVEIDEVQSNVGYTTRMFHKPGGVARDAAPLVVLPDAPRSRRAGLVFPMGEHGYMVALAGWCRDYVPRTPEGFLEFARSLDRPELAALLEGARPSPSEHAFRARANTWRRYERMSRWPDGFVVVGDAVASVNPVYGQGMTIAAIEVMEMKRALDRLARGRSAPARLSDPGRAHRLQRAFARTVQFPWLLVTSEDLRHNGTVGRRPRGLKIINALVQAVHELVAYDEVIHQAFFELLNMVRAPRSLLLRPGVLLRVAKHLLTKRSRVAALRSADAPRALADASRPEASASPALSNAARRRGRVRIVVAAPGTERARAMKRPSLTFSQWRAVQRSGKLVSLRRAAYRRRFSTPASEESKAASAAPTLTLVGEPAAEPRARAKGA